MKVAAKFMLLAVVMGLLATGIGVSQPQSDSQKPSENDNPSLPR